MKLLYKKEHTTCLYYDNSADPQIEVKSIYRGQPFDGHSHQCTIIVVLEGSATYKLRGLVITELQEGQILLIAPDKHFSISTKKTTKLLAIRLTQLAGLCECFPLESLLQHRNENNKEITLLEANPAIDIFVTGLTTSLKQGLRCKYYLETKTKELFYLLRGFYTKEQLAQFFNEMLHIDAHLYYLIKQNYQRINSIPEFAKVLNINQLVFEKKFKEIFGMPPYKWIIQQKSKDIHHALCTENTPLKELATRFGFSSKSSFSDFCKKNLGAPPGHIRENILVNNNANDE